MAKISNPRKVFNWSIQIIPDPINPFLFQVVKLPDYTVDQVKHGDTNHDIKTAGRAEVSNMTAEKLMKSNESDTYMWGWINACQSILLGGGSIPDIYKKSAKITELAEDGSTVINTWEASGLWPCKVNGHSLDRMKSENTLENIEFSVDELEKV